MGCAACFPAIASLGAAIGLGFLGKYEGLFDDGVSLEKQTWELWQKHDKTGFAALMDSDFIDVDTHGVAVKTQNVADIDNLIKESYDLSDFQVHRVASDAVFLTYRVKLKGRYKGTGSTGPTTLARCGPNARASG
jgi:hypothetical protein